MPVMPPPEFLEKLKARGLSISADGDMLRLTGPKSARRPAVLSYLKTFKPQIMQILRQEAEPAPANPSDFGGIEPVSEITHDVVSNLESAPLSYREMLLSAFNADEWRTPAQILAALPEDFPAADADAVTEMLEEAQRARSIERREFTDGWEWRVVPLSETGITDPFTTICMRQIKAA